MNIVMAAGECVPFIKVGGLADVVGTLSIALKEKKHDVRVFLPRYQKIDRKKYQLKKLPQRVMIPLGNGTWHVAALSTTKIKGVTFYFVENGHFFDRPEVYGDAGGDYSDNHERYIFFQRAVLEFTKALQFKPDTIHCHDWQTGLIPVYLKTVYKNDQFYDQTATVFSIHNIAYHGRFPAEVMETAGIPWSEYTFDKMEHFDTVNFLKSGINYADMIATVSPSYAEEIQTPQYGCELDPVITKRKDRLVGILNGIDYTYWNPSSDEMIAATFDVKKPEGKETCKRRLQAMEGFKQDPSAFLIGCVSRFDAQKGFDLIVESIHHLMRQNTQLAVLGRGSRVLEEAMGEMARVYPGRITVCNEFNESLAHKIYAGSDAFLMPSRFEPCGLSQMIALAYGTVPIVHKTGGLSDTITHFSVSTGLGNGFVFNYPERMELTGAFDVAERTFRDKPVWKKLQQNCFASLFPWDRSADRYVELYHTAKLFKHTRR